jgi:hypothetical protein
MRRIAVALAVALTGLALAGPAEAKGPSIGVRQYKITRAEGVITVTFHGDEAAGCRARGVCGVSGTSTYSFGQAPRFGEVVWIKRRKRTLEFYGFLETHGQAVSDVTTEGNQEHCVDRSTQEYESLTFEPHSEAVRFNWRVLSDEGEPEGGLLGPSQANPFDTRCTGPELVDMWPDRALPYGDVPYSVFTRRTGSFETSKRRLFMGGGFAGSVEWNLRYDLRLRQRRAGGFFAIPIN